MDRPDPDTFPDVDLRGVRSTLDDETVEFAILFGSRARGSATETSDVDIGIRFRDRVDDTTRFRNRNRLDAELQAHAESFVDVSDIDELPTELRHRILDEGLLLVGDPDDVTAYADSVTDEYTRTAADRDADRREFIDRLARGEL